MPKINVGEELLAAQLRQAGILFMRELQFDEARKYRADFAIGEDLKLLVEVEGGVWNRGYHVRGGGFENGCEKQALAMILGYHYLRVTTAQVESGDALEWIRALLE